MDRGEQETALVGVIPAAGEGKRLGLGCKALIEVNGKLLITYAMDNMVSLGIKTIFVIHHGDDIKRALGYEYKDATLIYVEQEDRKGIAHAISLLDGLDHNMLIILGDVIYLGNLDEAEIISTLSGEDCLYGVQEVKDKSKICKSYGITFDDKIIEKPDNVDELYPYLGLGIYFVSPNIFEYIRNTPVNKRTGRVEFTDVIGIIPDHECDFIELEGYYANINTKEELDEVIKNVSQLKWKMAKRKLEEVT